MPVPTPGKGRGSALGVVYHYCPSLLGTGNPGLIHRWLLQSQVSDADGYFR